MRIRQAVRQVVRLQVHLPRRAAAELAVVADAQVQHAVAGGGAFKLGHAVLAGHLDPFDLAFPSLPVGVQADARAGGGDARQAAAACVERGAHGVAEQRDAQVAVQTLAHLAFDAGEGGVGLAVLQQLQAIDFIERAAVDVVVDAVAEDADAKGGVAAGLLEAHVDVLRDLGLQVGVATLIRAGGHVQALGIQLFGRRGAAGAGERGADLVAGRELPHRAQRCGGAVVAALDAAGLRFGRLAVVAQGGFEAPVAQAVFLQREEAQLAGDGGLHVGLFAVGAELALRGLQADQALEA